MAIFKQLIISVGVGPLKDISVQHFYVALLFVISNIIVKSQIGMNCSFVPSEDMSCSGKHLWKWQFQSNQSILLKTWPESPIAVVAGNDNSLQMICFNVVFNGAAVTFLSTDFAQKSSLKSIGAQVLTYLHHWLHLLIKILRVSNKVMCNFYCSVWFGLRKFPVWCLAV